MHTCRCIFSPSFLGFVYTAIAGHLSDEIQSNEGSKHFTGRIKESQSFLTTWLRLIRCYPVSAMVVFFYILIHIFQCQFRSVDLFFFLFYFSSFQSCGSSGFLKNAVFIFLSPSVVLAASAMMFTDVSSCFCLPSCRESVRILHFHQSVPFVASV